MTRLPAKTESSRPPASARVAVVHRQGDAWRLVVVRLNAGVLDVIASRSLGQADAAGATALLREHRIETLVHVIPSSKSVCRAAQLPEDALSGPPAALLGALWLQAEADLPVSIPPHRRTAGIVRPGPESSPPIPLLVGWQPGGAADPFANLDIDVHLYVPEPVAVAALAAAPAPAGAGGAEVAAYADRAEGTVAVFASGIAGTRSIARIVRVDNTSANAWAESVRSAVAQTRAAAGLAPAPIAAPTTATAVLLAGQAGGAGSLRVTGASTDPSWREQFGIALGAAIVATSSDPLWASFSRMTPEAPGRSGSPVMRAVNWLAVPRRAAVAIAACLAVLLLWPLGVAAARNWVLSGRSGGAGSLVVRLDAAEKQAAFYEVLRSRRWPMTKLLADLSSAAPVGITVESIELSPESGATGVAVRGSSDSRDAIAAFVKNLSDTRIFDDVATPMITEGEGGGGGGGGGGGVDFRLQARVAGALLKVPPAEDYAKKPLAERLYGEGAKNTFTSTGSSGSGGRGDSRRGEDNTRGDRNSRRGDRAVGGAGDRASARTGGAAEAPKPADIPPPISDAEIAKLDRAGALREFTTRNRAATAAGLEEATRARLKEEAGKAKQRMLDATKETPG